MQALLQEQSADRALAAAAAMGAALFYARDLLVDFYAAGLFARLLALATLVACAVVVYFGVAFAIGAVSRERVALFLKKTEPKP